MLGITFSWSPSSVKSKAFGQILAHFTNDHYFPPSSSFLLLFCFFLLPLVTVMPSGSEFLLPLFCPVLLPVRPCFPSLILYPQPCISCTRKYMKQTLLKVRDNRAWKTVNNLKFIISISVLKRASEVDQ